MLLCLWQRSIYIIVINAKKSNLLVNTNDL